MTSPVTPRLDAADPRKRTPHIRDTIIRAAESPDGVTNVDVRNLTGLHSVLAGSRLSALTRRGDLFKARIVGQPNRWFRTQALCDAWLAAQPDAKPAPPHHKAVREDRPGVLPMERHRPSDENAAKRDARVARLIATQPAHKQPAWASVNQPNDQHARATAAERAGLAAVIPPNVKITRAPTPVDTRYAVDPGYVGPFSRAGIGRYLEVGV